MPVEKKSSTNALVRGTGCARCHYSGIIVLEATRMGEHYFDMPAPCPDCQPKLPQDREGE